MSLPSSAAIPNGNTVRKESPSAGPRELKSRGSRCGVGLTAAVLLFAGTTKAAETGCASPDFGPKADEYLSPYAEAHALSGAVLFIKDGRVLIRRAFDQANREWGIPNEPTTRFRLASVSKQFAAAAILQLADQGKLSIDDPISKFYADAPARWSKVTIKTLLNHTSGIADYTEAPDFDRSAPPSLTFEEIMKRVREQPLQFEPGSKFHYDNTGYILLGYVITKASGHTYGEYLKSHVFDPLGMKDSGLDAVDEIVPRRAAGYTVGPQGWVNAPYQDTNQCNGACGVYSSVDDLWTWERALFGGKVISPASLKLMTTDWGDQYGFGLSVDHVANHEAIFHSGGMPGARAGMYWFPKDRIVSIALANFDGVEIEEVASDLAKLCLGVRVRPEQVVMTPDILDRFVGNYQLSASETLQISQVGDHLLSTASGDTPTPIYAESDHAFFAKIRQFDYSFELDASGHPTALNLLHHGMSFGRFPRISPADPKPPSP